MKTCTHCGQSHDMSEFYARSSRCKRCVRARVSAYRAANADRVRAYDRERAKRPHVKARIGRIAKRWRECNPEWRKAQTTLGNALRDGLLIRPEKCSRCRQRVKVQAHHWDYSRPLVVEWLCKPCHAKADQERRAA